MIYAECMAAGLEALFSRIEKGRMSGVPVINKALHVQAIGFRPWKESCLGVLITPWFMNLMLLPQEGNQWDDLSVGKKVTHLFPSGPYEFIIGYEEEIGFYQMCSIFSPMFAFEDQKAAIIAAETIMAGLMDKNNREALDMNTKEIERRWYGETEEDEEKTLSESATLEKRMQLPLTRRALLTGNFNKDS